MKKTVSKLRRLFLSILAIAVLLFSYFIINYNKLTSVYSTQSESSIKAKGMEIVLGGEAVGIKLLATGVLVVSVDREDITDIKVSDVILKMNSEKVETNAQLSEIVKKSNGNVIELEIDRKGSIFISKIRPVLDELSGEYRLGLWVKDSSAGVGTVTFYDKKKNLFAALGHGVTETKENTILNIDSGAIVETHISLIQKAQARLPGELKGSITDKLIGQITLNKIDGIYGFLEEYIFLSNKKVVEIGDKTSVKEGKAKIYCTLDDNIVSAYDVKIEKVFLTSDGNKNIIIKVEDKVLLEKTGGIIQGMSGSPIVQDGKLIGAVTHVFLNDPTRGYGVFIQSMIDEICNVRK